MFERKDKRIIYYTRLMSGIPTLFMKKKISGNVKNAGLKNNLFPFDVNSPTLRVKNRFYYFFDVDKGQSYISNPPAVVVNPKLYNAIMKEELGKQLITSIEHPSLITNWILLLLALGMGGAIGFIIGGAVGI